MSLWDVLKYLGLVDRIVATAALVRVGEPAPLDIRGIRIKGKSYTLVGTLTEESGG